MITLSIPTIDPEQGLAAAAIAYINAGWFVGPLRRGDWDGKKYADAKNPGTVLGRSWQSKTSRDLQVVSPWFVGTDATGIFLHVGRSGAIIFDVDKPHLVPPILAKWLWFNPDAPVEERRSRVPFQSTRLDEPGRGHYLFAQPLDRLFGNGHGNLGSEWGEVRGNNGIIVAEPTEHESPEVGRYLWVVRGDVPPIAEELKAEMPELDASEPSGAVSDERVEAFFALHDSWDRAQLIKGPARLFAAEVKKGASRHDMAVKYGCQMMREARMGFYGARDASGILSAAFIKSLEGEKNRYPSAEYKGIIAWCVGQAELIDVESRRKEMEARLEKRDERLKRQREERMKPPVPPTLEVREDPLGLLAPRIDPDQYFADKAIGLDVQLLATHILDMGPLAVGRDGLFWRYDNGVWRPDKDVIRNRSVMLLGPRYRSSHMNNARDVAASRTFHISCDPLPDYFNCRNGMLNWKTGELEEHSPAHFSTVQFPWDWTGEEECPIFDKYLSDALTPDYVELAWQMMGYALYSGNPRHRAFLLNGKGGNGKSTLLKVIINMLGIDNIATETLTALNTSKFSAVNLYGKIANIAGDIEATFQTETNVFKAITGQDVIGAEHKYGSRFNFASWAVPIFSANKIPGSADVTEGYLRRWLMIRFDRRPTKVIPNFEELMYPEIPGIAAKARKHLIHIMANDFKTDGEIAAGLEEFAMSVDQVRLWIDECCESRKIAIVGSPVRTPRNDLYKSYKAWASDNNYGTLRAHEFYSRLVTAGFRETKQGGIRCFEGIKPVLFAMRGESYDKSDPWVDNASTS